ncbi:hypothetical protein F4774DRAFT_76257 [Daldinia eschscholtzii]|nr:hypothetical protein F4774DRAFT_76257 [Daldinia eschscholtzii]
MPMRCITQVNACLPWVCVRCVQCVCVRDIKEKSLLSGVGCIGCIDCIDCIYCIEKERKKRVLVCCLKYVVEQIQLVELRSQWPMTNRDHIFPDLIIPSIPSIQASKHPKPFNHSTIFIQSGNLLLFSHTLTRCLFAHRRYQRRPKGTRPWHRQRQPI